MNSQKTCRSAFHKTTLLVLTGALLPLAAPAAEAPKKPAAAVGKAQGAAQGLTFEKWSGSLNVPDPVACSVDPQGRVYVTTTTRRKVADLDIREYPKWIPDDVSLTSVEEKAAFYHEQLAPGKLRLPLGSIKDHNGDGSIDWKDLTAFTERIYQLRDTDGDGVADKITVFAEGFNTEVTGIAAGVLCHDGWVYATIAPDLWRLKDTDDDGVADVREVVAHGFGIHIAYAGHDMHGLSVGPDGRIYWSIGDKGVNVTSREGRHFFHPNEGCILRVEPDGSHFEVFAHGLRNPQEPAFDDFGDLIAVDNDADFKGEKERLAFVVEGSDSGWRCNYQYLGARTPWVLEKLWETSQEGQPLYLLPPLAYSGNGPAGFKHDPGTALGPAQRGFFFLNEFPGGVMQGFQLQRNGAAFQRSTVEALHSGLMGIGLAWHPDGSLFIADWMGGYPTDGLGAVWRMDTPAGADAAVRKQTGTLLQAGFAKLASKELSAHLSHRDQRVRQGAQFELAKRGEYKPLLAIARNSKAPLLARIHGIWGYGQLLRREAAPVGDVLGLLSDKDPEVRAQTARILGESAATPEQASKLIALLSDASPRARMQGALALGRLKVSAAMPALMSMAEKDFADPALRHAVVTGLAGCASSEELAKSRTQSVRAARAASLLALRRQASPMVAGFLNDPDPALVAEAARAIHDGPGIPEALKDLAHLADARPSDTMTMRRAINAALRIGTPERAQVLLGLVLDPALAEESRSEALASLAAWKQPPRQDRVDGYARQISTGDIAGVLGPKLDALLALTEPGLKQGAIELMLVHGLKARPEQAAGIVADSGAAGKVRAEAFRMMAAEHRSSGLWEETLQLALGDKAPAELQMVALEALLPGQPGRLAEVAAGILSKGGVAQKQHCVAQLALAGDAACDIVLERLGEDLVAGKCAASIRLDVLEALGARAAAQPKLAALARNYSQSADGVAHAELAEGGDAARGRELVLNHLGANCLACHSVGDTGSSVGPNLRAIGLEKDRAYLVESLVSPSARIAPGFGIASITLSNGTVLGGTLMKEDAGELLLRLPDGSEQKVPVADIASRAPVMSLMPPMLGILKASELRDVVAHLAGLKSVAKGSAGKTAGH